MAKRQFGTTDEVFAQRDEWEGRDCQKKYVRVIQDMYEGARTPVRTSVGTTGWVSVSVDLYQGSSVSPNLFDFIMDVLAKGVKVQTPWCMKFDDDVFIANTSKEEIERKLDQWKRVSEDRGLKSA
nr:uncharacterized protein LOC113802535 [Penaeus vannamei]